MDGSSLENDSIADPVIIVMYESGAHNGNPRHYGSRALPLVTDLTDEQGH